MLRRLTGIAALLLVLLMTPVSLACVVISHCAKVQQNAQQVYCPQKDLADACCKGSSHLCRATQAPAELAPHPGLDISPLMPSPVVLAVAYQYRLGSPMLRRRVLGLPVQHAPPGLLIAATTVLRI